MELLDYLVQRTEELQDVTLTSNDVPRLRDVRKLWDHCSRFMTEQKVGSAEAIYQSDRVILNAYEFIEGIADIVGYHKDPDDE